MKFWELLAFGNGQKSVSTGITGLVTPDLWQHRCE